MTVSSKRLSLLLLCAASLSLAACQSVKNELGVGRNSPDEFTVVKRAPLSLPPDYGLRAPTDSSVAPASDAIVTAKSSLLGESAVKADAPVKSSDEVFLKKTGAPAADPNIRSVINKENGLIAIDNQKIGDKLIFWKEQNPDDNIPSSVIDAKKEAERIKGNKEEGKPVNEGNVPVIEKKQSTIDKLF